MIQDIEIMLRPGVAKDESFISNSWLKSFRGSPINKDIPARVYYYFQHKVLEKLVNRSEVIVACNSDNSDEIFGYICAEVLDEVNVIHYIYVKEAYRGYGIANQLVDKVMRMFGERPVCYTHKTSIFAQHKSKITEGFNRVFRDVVRDRGYVYHPYLIHSDRTKGFTDGT